MVTIGEFPHHDAHHYANDDRGAYLTLFLIGLFWAALMLFVLTVVE